MKSFGFALLTTLALPVIPLTMSAAPVVPGLSNKHPLTEPQVGQLLMGELRCFACHSRKDAPQPLERSAPDLARVGVRLAPTFLRQFIASPSAMHAGTTMPDLLAGESAEQRDKIAEAITHFLVAQSPRKFERQPVGVQEAAAGKALFHTVGCVACHSPREAGKEIKHEGVVELGHVPAKYSLASLSDFLFQPDPRSAVGPDAGHEIDAGRGQSGGQLSARHSPNESRGASATGEAGRPRQGALPTAELRGVSQARRRSCREAPPRPGGGGPDPRVPVRGAGQGAAVQPEHRPNQGDTSGAREESRPALRQGAAGRHTYGVQLHRVSRPGRLRRRPRGRQRVLPVERERAGGRGPHSSPADAGRRQIARRWR